MSATRRRAGLRELDEDQLHQELEDWAAVCDPIPQGELTSAYYTALRERTVRSALQPGEIYQTWRATRESRTSTYTPPLPNPDEPLCYYCDGNGWQRLEMRPGYEELRGCACSRAPSKYRRDLPMREPHWRKRLNGVWERV